MNLMNLKFPLAVLFMAVVGATVQAETIVGETSASSGTESVTIGLSTVPFGPHTWGKAGVGVSIFPIFHESARVDFLGLSHTAIGVPFEGRTIWTISHDPKTEKTAHRIGLFNFAQVGDQDVWFGEWSTTGQEGGWANHQVYYAGDVDGTSVPTKGQATYKILGINRFTGDNALTGLFNVDFAAGKVSGDMSDPQGALYIKLSNVTFKLGAADFNGSAMAYAKEGGFKGAVQGRFYGKDAAGLAGFTQFDKDHRMYDTSFGGTKQ